MYFPTAVLFLTKNFAFFTILLYDICPPFVLDNIEEVGCKAEFRVEKPDLPRLLEAMQLPPRFTCQQRSICDAMEGLCMLLRRVSYPCRYSDLIPQFGGKPVSVISLITNHVIDYIFETHGHLITERNHNILNPQALQSYADAISKKGAPLTIVLASLMALSDQFADQTKTKGWYTMDIKGFMPLRSNQRLYQMDV